MNFCTTLHQMSAPIICSALAAATLWGGTASSADEVNLYSGRQPFLMNPLLETFTADTGIKVNMVYMKKGMFERLKSEGVNSPADLVLTTDIGNLNKLLEGNVLQSVYSSTLNSNIPAQYRHSKGFWYALTTRARIIYTHKTRVKPGEIKNYEDLAAPHMKGRVCTRSGKHSYNVALLASIISAKSDFQAETWAKGVKANLARKPQGNDRAQVKAVYEGECDVAVGNTYYMGKMQTNEKKPEQKKWAAAVNIIFPNQSNRGTHVNISGGAVTASAKNKDNAIKLLEFLSGDKAQTIYAEGNFEYPVKVGVQIPELVASWGTFKADTVSMDRIAERRTQATKIMDRVRFDN